ncbi:unnamed protein product, partial [Rotaria magnacalcarata]
MQQQNDDDEQIEKTLKYFDEILDEYLCDDDITDENTVHKSHSQTRFTNVTPVQHVKQSFQASLNLKRKLSRGFILNTN